MQTPDIVRRRLKRLEVGRKTSFGWELAEEDPGAGVSDYNLGQLRQAIARTAKSLGIKVSIHKNTSKRLMEATRVA